MSKINELNNVATNDDIYHILVYDPYYNCFVQINNKIYITVTKRENSTNTILEIINNNINTLDNQKNIHLHMITDPILYRHDNVQIDNNTCERIIITAIDVIDKGIYDKNTFILSMINYNPNRVPCSIYNNEKKITQLPITDAITKLSNDNKCNSTSFMVLKDDYFLFSNI